MSSSLLPPLRPSRAFVRVHMYANLVQTISLLSSLPLLKIIVEGDGDGVDASTIRNILATILEATIASITVRRVSLIGYIVQLPTLAMQRRCVRKCNYNFQGLEFMALPWSTSVMAEVPFPYHPNPEEVIVVRSGNPRNSDFEDVLWITMTGLPDFLFEKYHIAALMQQWGDVLVFHDRTTSSPESLTASVLFGTGNRFNIPETLYIALKDGNFQFEVEIAIH